MTGTVAWFEDEKGFGKIRTNDGELFFHWTEITGQSGRRSLAMGDRVEFEVGEHRGRAWSKCFSTTEQPGAMPNQSCAAAFAIQQTAT